MEHPESSQDQPKRQTTGSARPYFMKVDTQRFGQIVRHAALTPEQVGVFTLLTHAQFEDQGPLSDDVRRLAVRLGFDVRQVRRVLAELVEKGLVECSGGLVSAHFAAQEIEKFSRSYRLANEDLSRKANKTNGAKVQELRTKKPPNPQGGTVGGSVEVRGEGGQPASTPDTGQALEAYNAVAERAGWRPCPHPQPDTVRKLGERVGAIGGLENFRRAVSALPGCEFGKRMASPPDLHFLLKTKAGEFGNVLERLLEIADPTGGSAWPEQFEDPAWVAARPTESVRKAIAEHVGKSGRWLTEKLGPPPDHPKFAMRPDVFDATTRDLLTRHGIPWPPSLTLPSAEVVPFPRSAVHVEGRVSA